MAEHSTPGFSATLRVTTMHEYILILLATVATALGQGETVDGLSPEELAAKLEAANVLVDRDFDTTFEYRWLNARPQDDDSPWNLEDWQLLNTFRYVALGNKFYTERLDYKRSTATGVGPTVQYRQQNLWAKGAWAHRVDGQQAVSFYAQPGPTDMHSQGFKFNLLQGRYPSALGSLSELVRTGTVLKQTVDDDLLILRIAADDASASLVQYTIRAQIKPAFVLLGYTIELSDSQTVEDFQRYVYMSQAYTVLEWEQVGDLRIPKVAVIESIGPADRLERDGRKLRSRAIYTRQSFREIAENDIDPELFTVPLPMGTGVYDDRIKLSFEIGNTYLSLDGTLFQLNEPVMEHPGDRLAEMIQNATPQHPPSGSSSLSTSVPGSAAVLELTRSGLLRSPIVLAGLVGVGVALLTLAVIRARRAQRKAA